MGELQVGVLAYIALVLVIGGVIKGALGFGSNLLVIPLLALVIDPRVAIALCVIPALVALPMIFWRMQASRADASRIAPFLLPLALGTAGGAALLVALSRQTISVAVGVLTIGFTLLSVLRLQPKIPPQREALVSPLAGLACGVVGGASSVHGPLVAVYLHGLGLEKRAFVVAFAYVFLVGGLVQLASYTLLGVYTPALLLGSVAACLPVLLGTRLGLYLHSRLHQAWFNRIVLAGIFISGVSLIVR